METNSIENEIRDNGTEKKGNGAFVGSVIIIIILIIGGIYIWQSKIKNVLETKNAQQEIIPADTEELNTLEQDLNNINSDINVDVNTIN